jgi:hypothetical protein
MKITVEHEIPDEEDCSCCLHISCSNCCRLFLAYIKAFNPCPACMEARKSKEK